MKHMKAFAGTWCHSAAKFAPLSALNSDPLATLWTAGLLSLKSFHFRILRVDKEK
jgi:hypothetical protein